MISHLYVSAILAFLFSSFITYLVIAFCRQRSLVIPRKLGVKALNEVPYLGGLAFTLPLILIMLMTLPYKQPDAFLSLRQMTLHTVGIILSVLVLFVWGLIVDTRKLDTRLILVGQVAALLILFCCGVKIRYFSWIPDIASRPVISLVITFLWLFFLMNFVRFLDGIDGLIPLLAALLFGVQYLMIRTSNETYTQLLCMVLLGVSIGFLIFNFYPARIYLGQNGSSIPGLLLGIVCIVSRQKSFLTVTFILPAFIIILTFSILFMRFLEREFLFKQRDIR